MDKQIPTAVRSGEIKIGDVVLKVYVLDDGRRIIEAESMVAFFDYLANGGPLTEKEAAEIARFVRDVEQ